MRIDAPAAARPARLPLIDAARGVAITAMMVYHFAWDLHFFGFSAVDVTQQFGWRIFARLIAGTFLFLVGVSLVLSMRHGFDRKKYLRRVGIIAAAALAITAVTYVTTPEAFIFFGILHCIALTSLLGLPFVRAPIALVLAAAVASFVVRELLAGPALDHPALLWLGFYERAPITNDYVPIFPWFGVVLAGIAADRLAPALWPSLAPNRELPNSAPRPLVWAGRHSLGIYLVHQPILFGLVYLAAQISPPSLLAFEPGFVASQTASCVETGGEADRCRRAWQCVADGVQEEGLWRDLMQDELSQAGVRRYFEISKLCAAGG